MTDPHEKIAKKLKRLQDRTYKQPVFRYPGMKYFYVFGFTKEGKKLCLGPYCVGAEADGVLAGLEQGEIFELDTRDLSRATRIIKEKLMERTGDADEAMKKVLHEKGLEKERKRRRWHL
jgi:hypothetical protein